MNLCETYAERFDALGHPVRFELFLLIIEKDGTLSVAKLVDDLNERLEMHSVEQPTVSFHLKKLRQAGLIHCTRRGLEKFYVVRPGVLTEMIGVIRLMNRQEVTV